MLASLWILGQSILFTQYSLLNNDLKHIFKLAFLSMCLEVFLTRHNLKWNCFIIGYKLLCTCFQKLPYCFLNIYTICIPIRRKCGSYNLTSSLTLAIGFSNIYSNMGKGYFSLSSSLSLSLIMCVCKYEYATICF